VYVYLYCCNVLKHYFVACATIDVLQWSYDCLQFDQRQPRRRYGLYYPHRPAHDARREVRGDENPRNNGHITAAEQLIALLIVRSCVKSQRVPVVV